MREKYLILTKSEADKIGKIKVCPFLGINPYAAPLKDGTFALPKDAIINEMKEYKFLDDIKRKLDIENMPSRIISSDEFDKSER